MPELPEVETICRGLRPYLRARRIVRVEVLQPMLRAPVDLGLLAGVAGRTILEVGRKGKYILIRLDGGVTWVFHLGMSGKLIHVPTEQPRRKHDHIIVSLDNGRELRYHDPRRFGLSLVIPGAELGNTPQLGSLGLDVFDRRFSGKYLYSATRRSRRRIRDLLIDQRIIAGLGNIYANEILFRAGIRPTTRARRLGRSSVERIAQTIPRLLRQAIRWCGTSFSDYRDADDRQGEFQNHLRVYDREGQPCRICPGTIKRVSLGNRSVFYCPTCQV